MLPFRLFGFELFAETLPREEWACPFDTVTHPTGCREFWILGLHLVVSTPTKAADDNTGHIGGIP